MEPDADRTPSFFSDKERAFWLLQCGGWAAYFVVRTLGGLANSMGLSFVIPTAIVTLTGFSITLLLSAGFRRIIRMKPVYVWSLTLLLLIPSAALFSILEVWAHSRFYNPTYQPEGLQFFGAILLDISVLGAWSGLYYGINFYLLLSRQTERMLTVAAQASEASLAMLRYQVNPHFLFNTLNSISTLVLLKENERANAMLSRLSSFLRYSLAEEPGSQVTLAQELEALKLYFDIERMRFEDRLQTNFSIEEEAQHACVPSMILQPLAENAIKYAVTPQEEGAEITVSARVSQGRLLIHVTDTGPGLKADKPAFVDGAGVGLKNIRDRLAQAYGEQSRFSIADGQDGGVVAAIEIPYQTKLPDLKEAAE
ncbi:sensor histidine kinase [Pacificimonas flava]|uniref:Sensor histidine kinase n=2 Tax=Pacificimonas TaxID=1960290 RepID=A0A219B4K7_9SPHN|nr:MULTISPECIES: histidine kinase [Pacificimonas]MBZ6379487.1 histidine kinase [Pacificimonas aurantium]OWV33322.1 sensor histidine kinase [Pacificimonas flava]